MAKQSNIIQQAEFNPAIKKYLLWVVAFYLFISLIGIPFLIFWFLGLGQYISRIYYEHLVCKLTDKHLEFKKGAMFKVDKTIPLENIQDLTFIENPLLKIFDLRILKIETAGQSNPQGSDMKLIGIIGTAEFKERVLEQRDLLKNLGSERYSQADTSDNKTLDLLTEIRDLLIEIKEK